jgi:guanylate kinase
MKIAILSFLFVSTLAQSKIYIVSGPSGGGKSVLCGAALKHYGESLSFSISGTSRKPRPKEIDGIDYLFLSPDIFDAFIKLELFAEHEGLFNNAYGTFKQQIERPLSEGKNVLVDVDVKGALKLRDYYGKENTVLIFIRPPSLEVLEQRLRARGTETEEQIQRRLARAREELALVNLYDYVVINDDRDRAIAEFLSLLTHSH